MTGGRVLRSHAYVGACSFLDQRLHELWQCRLGRSVHREVGRRLRISQGRKVSADDQQAQATSLWGTIPLAPAPSMLNTWPRRSGCLSMVLMATLQPNSVPSRLVSITAKATDQAPGSFSPMKLMSSPSSKRTRTGPQRSLRSVVERPFIHLRHAAAFRIEKVSPCTHPSPSSDDGTYALLIQMSMPPSLSTLNAAKASSDSSARAEPTHHQHHLVHVT